MNTHTHTHTLSLSLSLALFLSQTHTLPPDKHLALESEAPGVLLREVVQLVPRRLQPRL